MDESTWHAGRGTALNPQSRFDRQRTQRDWNDPDQWDPDELSAPTTAFLPDRTAPTTTRRTSLSTPA